MYSVYAGGIASRSPSRFAHGIPITSRACWTPEKFPTAWMNSPGRGGAAHLHLRRRVLGVQRDGERPVRLEVPVPVHVDADHRPADHHRVAELRDGAADVLDDVRQAGALEELAGRADQVRVGSSSSASRRMKGNG
jgi:hypothetical protein